MSLENFNVILCPTYEIAASQPQPDYSVEAEYGALHIEGRLETLAHHDIRSDNPAPCVTDVKSYEDVGGTIMISHIDTDTLGGIMAITGDKPNDPEFWEGAGHIDVAGPHHIHELSQDVQDKLNAVYAYGYERNEGRPSERVAEAKDVTDIVKEYYDVFNKILDREHPEHDELIEKGREYAKGMQHEIESRCVFENDFIRAFVTDGYFCAAGYYSEQQDKVIPATVTFNERLNSITVAFADGGQALSAKDIVQELWGPEAGGHTGIAGSPRGAEMTKDDFEQVQNVVMDRLIEHEHELEKEFDKDKDYEINR